MEGRFDFVEQRDMHFMYGLANGNSREAVRLYAERYPNRIHPDRRVFERIHRGLGEHGTLGRNPDVVGRPRTRRTVEFEEGVLNQIEDNPSTSTRAIAHELDSSNSTVWEVLKDERLKPFHFQKVQGLIPNDYEPRLQSSRWLLQQCQEIPDFASGILYTDESCFTRDGYFNIHNSHVWSAENPHATHVDSNQFKFSVNIWAGIVGDCLIGPWELPPRLNGEAYRNFLQNVLPVLLEDVPLEIRQRMWFQQDGAPAHFSLQVRQHLTDTFGEHWIGRGGPQPWPARSPDMTPCDFFLWGFFKDLIYATPVDTREKLVQRIHAAARQLRANPAIFARVRQNLLRRCQLCIEVQGRHFEHLM